VPVPVVPVPVPVPVVPVPVPVPVVPVPVPVPALPSCVETRFASAFSVSNSMFEFEHGIRARDPRGVPRAGARTADSVTQRRPHWRTRAAEGRPQPKGPGLEKRSESGADVFTGVFRLFA